MFSPSTPITSPDSHKLIDAIRDQTDGVPPHLVFVLDIVSVRFGGYFTPDIKAQIQRFPYLQMLTLNDCAIKSLDNFPHLPGLIRLDLVFNEIDGDSLGGIRGSRHIQTLMFGANKIASLEQLDALKGMKQLLQLDFINNPISKVAGYREKVFSLFPTLTVLDTLDKSGKDAYASSSMAVSVSRVPDALFDKSAPVIAPPLPSGLFSGPPVPASSAPIRKATSSRPIASAVSVPVRTNTVISKISTSGLKKGKTGKLGKLSKVTGIKSRSGSAKAGLVFPTGRIKRKMKEAMPTVRVAKNSSVYLAAVLEYLTAEILQGAGNLAKNEKKQRITPSQLKRSLKNDDELFKLLNGITFSMNEA